MSAREDKRERLLAMLEGLGGRKAAIPIVAEALTVSIHTVTSWTRPETSMSAREIPAMALELLAIKLKGASMAGQKTE